MPRPSKLLGFFTTALVTVGLGSPSTAQPCSRAALSREAGEVLRQRRLDGAIVVRDVRSGRIRASLQPDAVLLPLSTVKLLLFASYLEHRRGLPESIRPSPVTLIARGSDNAGRTLSLELRHALGEQVLLQDLARFGFPACTSGRPADCTTLGAPAADVDWANSMSLGEAGFRVTPLGMSRFLRAVANDGLDGGQRMMRAGTAAALRAAMLDTVQIGTARRVRDRLGTAGRLGGKTGTGPARAHPYDGIFAGLAFDRRGVPRLAFVTYVRGGGPGGGAAAEISADLSRLALIGAPSCRD